MIRVTSEIEVEEREGSIEFYRANCPGTDYMIPALIGLLEEDGLASHNDCIKCNKIFSKEDLQKVEFVAGSL